MSCCGSCSSAKGKFNIDPTIQEEVIMRPIRKIAMVSKKKSSAKTNCVKHFALCLYLGSRRAKDLAIIFMDWRKGDDGALINVVDWTRKLDSRQSYEVELEKEICGRRVTILTLRDFYNKGASKFDNCHSSATRMYESALRHPLAVLDDPNGNCYVPLQDNGDADSYVDSGARRRDEDFESSLEKTILSVDMNV